MWKYLEDLQIHRFIDKNRNMTTWTLINEVDSLAFVLLIILSEKDCKTWRPDFLMKGKYYVCFQQEIKKPNNQNPKKTNLGRKLSLIVALLNVITHPNKNVFTVQEKCLESFKGKPSIN